jgi:hypothetical protein
MEKIKDKINGGGFIYIIRRIDVGKPAIFIKQMVVLATKM